MSKKYFLDWVEQQPGNEMGPNELLREFRKKIHTVAVSREAPS